MPLRNAAKRQNCCAATRKVTPRAAKGFNWIVRIYCLCALVRGLQNLEASLKGFNCCGAKLPLRCADSRFAEPRSFPERERVYSFRVYEKNQKYTRGLRTSGLRGRFKALPEKILAKFSDGTSRNRFFAQTGGVKALNRCERVTVQLTQD